MTLLALQRSPIHKFLISILFRVFFQCKANDKFKHLDSQLRQRARLKRFLLQAHPITLNPFLGQATYQQFSPHVSPASYGSQLLPVSLQLLDMFSSFSIDISPPSPFLAISGILLADFYSCDIQMQRSTSACLEMFPRISCFLEFRKCLCLCRRLTLNPHPTDMYTTSFVRKVPRLI
jgi:hypothetical protein